MNAFQSLQRPKLAFIAAVVAAALGGAATAQQQQEPTRENANRPPAAAEQQTQIARSDQGLQSLEQYLQSKTLRVSKLVGMELQTRSGDNLGEVHDLIPSAAPGRDMQLIVSTGGVGADQKLVAVPFDEVQINADGDEIYTSRTREQLASGPPVALPSRTGDSAGANRSTAPQSGAGADTRTAPPAGAGSTAARGTASEQQPIADLVGAEVMGSGGDKVGEVDDIVISTAGADSVRAVLQVGGIAGIGEKRIALPLSQLQIEREGNDDPQLRVAMDLDALERMPEFKYEEQTAAL
jgi:sporulation protein YlmC with PRC-barrel domain